jgi:ComF family protein
MLDTLLPPVCLACDTPVEREGQFCVDCFRQTTFVSAPLCRCCGVPLPFAAAGETKPLCVACEMSPPAYTQARAALRYDAAAKKLILPLKYNGHSEAAQGLAELMRRPGEALLQAANLIVPVPMHLVRLRSRRFNQAALLAIALARATGRPLAVDGLVRERQTQPLEGLGASARRVELEGAISLRPGTVVAGKRVLVVDDVMTSGATVNECAKVLLAAGARRVDVLTAARVADPRLA